MNLYSLRNGAAGRSASRGHRRSAARKIDRGDVQAKRQQTSFDELATLFIENSRVNVRDITVGGYEADIQRGTSCRYFSNRRARAARVAPRSVPACLHGVKPCFARASDTPLRRSSVCRSPCYGCTSNSDQVCSLRCSAFWLPTGARRLSGSRYVREVRCSSKHEVGRRLAAQT